VLIKSFESLLETKNYSVK